LFQEDWIDIIKNSYNIKDDKVYIDVTNKHKETFQTIVDLNIFNEKLLNYDVMWHLSWYPNVKNYYVVYCQYCGIINGKPRYKTILLHRYVTEAKKNEYIDHKNHDTLNNTLDNINITTNRLNLLNRKGVNKNSISGYRNISLDKKTNEWLIQFQKDGVNTYYARFDYDKLDEAIQYTETKRKELYP
jgi:hypothetical protein